MSFAVSAPRAAASPDLIQSVPSPSESFTRLRVAAEIQARASLTVRTSEGDTVTLSAGRAARADLSSIAYDRTGRSTGPDLSAQLATAELTTLDAVEAIVEGDLNEQEREDLDALLTSIDDIAAAFFSGRIDQAVERALEIRDLGSLQSYRFDASYSSSTYVEQEVLGASETELVSDQAIAESGALAEAIEDFFASFIQRREDQAPLSLKALLPAASDQKEEESSETLDLEVLEQTLADSEGDSQAQAEPSPAPVEAQTAAAVPQSAEAQATVDPAPTVPNTEPAPLGVESETAAPVAEEGTQSDPEAVEPDPLAAFAQQIRERVEASGLADMRLGPYVPSLIQRVVEYRISLLISSLAP